MRRQEHGASYIPLIVVIVLLLIAVAWAWVKTDEVSQAKKELNQKAAEFATLQTKMTGLTNYLKNRLLSPVGFAFESDKKEDVAQYAPDVEKIKTFLGQSLRNLRDKYYMEFKVSTYTVAEDGGFKLDPSNDQTIKVVYAEPGSIPAETSLESLYNYMDSAMGRMLNDIKRLAEVINTQQLAAAEARTGYENTLKEKDDTIAARLKDYTDLQASTAKREQDLTATINGLRDEVRKAADDLEQEKTARKTEVSGLKTELTRAAQDVVKAKDRKVERELPIGPDGEVLAVTSGQDIAILNRGKDKHMMVGLTFDVYDYVKGSVMRRKGTVVVIAVEDNTSRARVVKLLSPMVPIVQGDLFESVAYNPDEQIHFFLLGRFQKFGRSDAAQRLTELGALVDKDVSVETDILVLGSPETEDENLRDSAAYKHAMELGVKVITEAQLSQFLLY